MAKPRKSARARSAHQTVIDGVPARPTEPPASALPRLAVELGDALKRIDPVIEAANDAPRLLLPGHHPVYNPMLHPKKGIVPWRDAPRVYEETSTIALSYLLARLNVSVFFDIGSAKGHFTRVAASRIAHTPTVYSFEMLPETANVQRRLLAGDAFGSNAIVNDVALTDTHVGGTRVWTARSSLFEELPPPSAYQEAWHRRLKFWLRGDRSRGLNSADILLTSLDFFARSAGVQPELLKVDVDGYELKVLKGARSILSDKRPAVMLELHTDRKQRYGSTRADVVNYLFDLGYRALLLTDHQDRLACAVEEIGRNHPILGRQQTDLFLFVHEAAAVPQRLPMPPTLRVVG